MIRRARVSDIERLDHILFQVQDVHANGRPDIFIKGAKKYNDEQLKVFSFSHNNMLLQ